MAALSASRRRPKARSHASGRRETLLRAQRERRTWSRSARWCKASPINGPQYFERYNIYRSATHQRHEGAGLQLRAGHRRRWRSSRTTLPTGFSYEWSEATYQEKKTGGQTGYIFALSLLFVFLVLAALYESWAMPIAILLVIPFGVFGAFSGLAAARVRQQRIHADRADHADRSGGQERDPDRRVREARARARRVDRRGRAAGRASCGCGRS